MIRFSGPAPSPHLRIERHHRGRLVAVALALLATASPLAALQVVDPEGRPLAAARVTVLAAPTASDALSRMQPPLAQALTDDAGEAAVAVPVLDGLLLIVDHAEHAPYVAPLPGPTARVVLERGTTWSGRVSFPGERLRGGRICAAWQTVLPAHAPRRWQRCADVAADGTFTLPGLGRERLQVQIRGEGVLPLERSLLPATDAVLRLEAGVLLRGRVLGPGDDNPIAAAWVATPEKGWTTSGEDGRFEIAVRALPVSLACGAEGYQRTNVEIDAVEIDAVEVAATGAEQPIPIRLVPGAELVGKLVDEGGEAIGEAMAWIEEERTDGVRHTRQHQLATTAGDFHLDLAGPGRYNLRIGAQGHEDVQRPGLQIVDGESRDLGTLVLRRGAGVSGLVLDPASSEPLAGVGVELLPQGPPLLTALRNGRQARTVSDEDGRFALFGLEAGRYELRLRRDGHALLSRSLTVEQALETDAGTLWLGPGTPLLGTVVDRRDQPRAGLRIQLFDAEQATLVPLAERVTDTDGTFAGPALSAGRYRLQVHGSRLLLSQEIEIADGEEEHDLRLVAGGVRLRGRVTAGGEPVAGGVLSLSPALDPAAQRGKIRLQRSGVEGAGGYGLPQSDLHATVEADGTFEIDEALPGLMRATFVGLDGEEAVRRLTIPDRAEAVADLEIGGITLAGTITDAGSALGLAADLRLLDDLGQTAAQARSDPEGAFTLAALAPGTYRLEARAEGYRCGVLERLELGPGEAEVHLALEAGESGAITFQLRRADGSPAGGIPTTLLSSGGTMAGSVPTDALGRRTFDHLAAGDYVLIWSDPVAGVGAHGPVRVEPGEPASHELRLSPGSTLELVCGAATPCEGTALDFLTLTAAQGVDLAPHLTGLSAVSRFSTAGHLSLGRLSPGTYRLRLWLAGREVERPLAVVAGTTARVRLP